MSVLRIAAIVEGHGETEAIPVLLQRYAREVGVSERLRVHPVIRIPASKLLKPAELERTIDLAARKLGGIGGILVLLDCEDDCPKSLAPRLIKRMSMVRSDIPKSLVLAHREYEAWFLGSASSIAGCRGLSPDLQTHSNPETVRGCKEWLSDQMARGRSYSEVDDQVELTRVFDLKAAKSNCPSFDKCDRELTKLLKMIAKRGR